MMIDRIKQYHLCNGCGLCSSVLGENLCKMQLEPDGFYSPHLKRPLTKAESALINNVCPGIHVEGNIRNMGTWGPMIAICEAWSADKDIRHRAASGGVVTSLAIYLLEQKKVDAILQVGVRDDSYIYNELRISRTKEDVIRNAQSRYAPALVFHRIKQILDSDESTFGFIGKPCDMAAMQNFIREYPQYSQRIKYYISIFCAGMPSYNGTIQTWKLSGREDAPITLKYRGDGWPGNFSATFSDGTTYQLSYNESWGKILGRYLGFRCKICPDGIGILADVAIGDSWNTKNGYPDFTEGEGRCFCMVRTETGKALISGALQGRYVEKQDIDIHSIREQQPYQWERRKLEGWRLIPVLIATKGLVRYKGLSIWQQSLKANLVKGLKNAVGTYKRIKRISKINEKW